MIRELTISEINDVSCGSEAACVASATLGAGAHSPVAGAIVAAMGMGAVGFGFICIYG